MSRVPFFRTEDRIYHLQSEARSWKGTPYCSNSDAKGLRGGVSCHNLLRSVLVNVGCLPTAFPKVEKTINATRHTKNSLIEQFMNDVVEFDRIDVVESDLIVGDVLGFRIFKCTDHLGILTEEDLHFLHVLDHKHADFDSLSDPTWNSRLMAAWRPMEIMPI